MRYPKIETVWNRNNDFEVMRGEYRKEEFALVNRWFITEKIHGRNHRVILFPDGRIEHRGRTDKAQFADFMLDGIDRIFDADRIRSAFIKNTDGTYPNAVIYGELYGNKIQGKNNYSRDVQFRAFDIKIEDWWLKWEDVEGISKSIGVETVPTLGYTVHIPINLIELKEIFTGYDGICESYLTRDSEIYTEPEGIVARTRPQLFDRTGRMLKWKLKISDFE